MAEADEFALQQLCDRIAAMVGGWGDRADIATIYQLAEQLTHEHPAAGLDSGQVARLLEDAATAAGIPVMLGQPMPGSD